MHAFIGAVRDGHHAQPDGRTGLRALQIMLAAQLSARTGTTVSLSTGT